MDILVINAGSSSMKFQLINMEEEKVLIKGNCERIGIEGGLFKQKTFDGRELVRNVDMKNHSKAFRYVQEGLLDKEYGVISDLSDVTAIGHRVVQGGALFQKSVVVDDEVLSGIESLIPLAPLHNPAHVQGIRACQEVFGKDVPEVVVFDTAFHSTMPREAYMYAIPYEYYEKYSIRKYGFHGTSHRYISERAAKLMGRPLDELKIITCHLGNGSSITAIDKGKAIDTSMGLTPLDGFLMGTRSGGLDPSVVTYLAEKEGMSMEQMNNLLNKKSGLLGISGVSSDDRDICKAVEEGNDRARLAHEMLEYQIKKYIGSYTAALNGLDAIVFSGGLGENQYKHRQIICEGLSFFGVTVDPKINEEIIQGKEGEISTPDSKVKVYVIPTNEEIVIARDTQRLISK